MGPLAGHSLFADKETNVFFVCWSFVFSKHFPSARVCQAMAVVSLGVYKTVLGHLGDGQDEGSQGTGHPAGAKHVDHEPGEHLHGQDVAQQETEEGGLGFKQLHVLHRLAQGSEVLDQLGLSGRNSWLAEEAREAPTPTLHPHHPPQPLLLGSKVCGQRGWSASLGFPHPHKRCREPEKQGKPLELSSSKSSS